MRFRLLLLVLALAACGRDPVGPGIARVPTCVETVRWQKYYMTDSLGVGRVDSVRVAGSLGCG